ncbi:MAG: hypothetical protein ACP5RQ_02810 [Candidatus Micrarchaeia archaeon]
MVLNPDDLLIFKTREEKEKEEKEKKKKEGKTVAAQEEQKSIGIPASANGQGQVAAKPQAERQQIAQPAVSFNKPIVQEEEKGKPIEAEREIKNIAGNELIFYKVAPVEAAEEIETGKAETELAPEEIKKISQKKHLSAKDSRRIGEHMSCTWHPWRQAYAICDYCRRPFCYEDLVEHNGLYYCLEDIDKVTNIRAEELSNYNSFRVVTAITLFLAFAIFFYYNYNMILSLPLQLQKIGLNNYFENIFNPLTPEIIETALIVFGLLVSFMVSADIKKSFQLTIISTILSMLFFSYEFIKTSKLYLGLIGLLSFIALVAIIYSKTSYSSIRVPSEEDLAAEVLKTSKASF